MISVFCTLFDSNYLDKGLALYYSMQKHIANFRLYIVSFDEKCFEVLSDLKLKNVTVIPVKNIMTSTLQRLQTKRTRAEFCWTCTPTVIEYVLTECGEKICTYIDADIYFFADPVNVIQEIIDAGRSVGLVRHGFERDYGYGEWVFSVGKYCIEFNTFLNNRDGMQVLGNWKEDCLNWCYNRVEDGKLGDQKYPDKWRVKYDCVHESQNLGAGVAPWNLHLYTIFKRQNDEILIKYRDKLYKLIFYHFEGMKYLDNGRIHLGLWDSCRLGTGSKVKLLYREYLKRIADIRSFLSNKYDITFGHMVVDKNMVLGEGRLLKQFVLTDGLFKGSSKWVGYRCNGLKKIME